MKKNLYAGVEEELVNENKRRCKGKCDDLKQYEDRIDRMTREEGNTFYISKICGMMGYMDFWYDVNMDFTAQLKYMNNKIETTRRECIACFSELLATSSKYYI